MDRQTWREWHREYLASPEWATKRAQVYARVRRDHGGRLACEWCGTEGGPWNCHHLRYPRHPKHFGLEPLDSIALLCRDCHLRAHNRHTWEALAAEVAAWRPGDSYRRSPPGPRSETWEELAAEIEAWQPGR